MNTDLKQKIDMLKNSQSEDDRKQCIPLLKEYLSQNSTDAIAWYDLAGCYDYCGLEKEAEPCYWKTYELGWQQLPNTAQPAFFVGFGSTLRNNLKFKESEKVLTEAVAHFTDCPALKVFLAFTLYSQRQFREASKLLFEASQNMPERSFDGFEKAIKWYTDNLDTHPEEVK